MRKWINLLTEAVGPINSNEIKAHMRDSIMNDRHYEGGFNGLMHFTSSDARHDMADNWEIDPDGPEFEHHLDQWVEARYDEVIKLLDSIEMIDGQYKVTRSIHVKPDWIDSFPQGSTIPLGEYWSFDVEYAGGGYGYWKPKIENGQDVEIEALVPARGVNWTYTVYANMDWESSDERELRLIPGTPLRIKNLTIGKTVIDPALYHFVV